jgi:tRNA A37 threonylcarbamoyladenosine biosynthesis protein TsaE
MKLKLKRFDISRITPDKIVVLIGKRNTGKSYIVRDIMYNNKDLPIGTVISPTEMANKFYGEMIPKVFIHEEYTPKLLENVIIRQKDILISILDVFW